MGIRNIDPYGYAGQLGFTIFFRPLPKGGAMGVISVETHTIVLPINLSVEEEEAALNDLLCQLQVAA